MKKNKNQVIKPSTQSWSDNLGDAAALLLGLAEMAAIGAKVEIDRLGAKKSTGKVDATSGCQHPTNMSDCSWIIVDDGERICGKATRGVLEYINRLRDSAALVYKERARRAVSDQRANTLAQQLASLKAKESVIDSGRRDMLVVAARRLAAAVAMGEDIRDPLFRLCRQVDRYNSSYSVARTFNMASLHRDGGAQ